ncbi:uncharacterized protein B0H18DRAFT_1085075 [Fomitopsis serialis]|uniref:uncharacterized protein n=1 Tax=Fomitopsis serialis TaxID=139415 RepID=UPI002008E910|nr:uncharacterized protein B0H18DRAFT_1085075 [Neoantrodia serialis]KAH9926121.1 hypothetical protein B0H18DRAFT_1085075 [Neoantrodia serialis]
MDSVGWHARQKAKREEENARSPQRGPDGRFRPVEEIGPLDGQFIGGPPPPTPPPKDDPHYSVANGKRTPSLGTIPSQSSQYEAGTPDSPLHHLARMSAVERSRNLKVAHMEPYLQLMAGPLLRYDTVDRQGIWRGAALIVSKFLAECYCLADRYTSLRQPPTPLVSPISRGLSVDLGPHPADPHSTSRPDYDSIPDGPNAITKHSYGHELYVYVGHSGTFTFWRFMLEIPLGQTETRITYSVNRGLPLHFFVPGRTENMRWAAYSCNGFSAGVNANDFCGPGFHSGYDPVWTDLLAKHAEQPFHALVGGGDQLYCDGVVREPELQEWVSLPKGEKKRKFPLSEEMRVAIDRFYFNHYCHTFRSGAFARANCSIIGSRGYFFFLLFQCFINVDIDGRDDRRHPFQSLIIGADGPYIPFPSHSFLTYLGPQVWMLLLDCRAERKLDQVCSDRSYRIVFDRVGAMPPGVEHLVIQLGIPIAYPRMVFLENVLESKMNPLTALGRSGSLGLSGFVNKFNADAELLDDLNDHWTSKAHKKERNWLVEQMQRYAWTRHCRVTFLSGDVHCAAVGLFKTLRQQKEADIPPPLDHRYMLNIVSSNEFTCLILPSPPNPVLTMVSSLATKTHRTLHRISTDETMIPLFEKEPNGQPAKSKCIMGRRNWCAVWWETSGDLVFDMRVEIEKGIGRTASYPIRAPPPRWTTS